MRSRVNLLPRHYIERAVERRRAWATAAAMVALLLVLGLVGVVQARQLTAAEEQRDFEQAQTAQLQARRLALAPFRDLAEEVRRGQQLVMATMDTEVSWAGVLASLSDTFPGDATLTAFIAESTLPVFGDLAVQPGDEGAPIGTVAFNGYTVEGFAPGIADVLRRLGDVSGLSEPRLATGARGEIDGTPTTTFDGAVLLDGGALTGRYAEGLPPGEHVDVPTFGGAGAQPDTGAGGTE